MIDQSILDQVKEKSISDYLQSKGVLKDAKRSTAKNSFFHSPFTDDRTASLNVNEHKNSFFDYSAQLGGDIIKLCMELERCEFKTAVEKLSGLNLSNVKPPEETFNELVITKTHELKNLHLEDYLHYERKINVSLCYSYIQEVHFHFSKNPEKKQYAVGFKNDKGGFDLRSKFSKVAKSPKWFTTINPGTKKVSVFEGFMDFLSAVTFWNMKPAHTVIILNGSAMIHFVDFMPYSDISFYGDNDTGGNKAFAQMPPHTKDKRGLFNGYNDFNEFLVKRI
ncbi:toprim domain-containing protein [Pedobacter sp. SD-b]|uniref:Toprim domain-containing protein n=1 Tax=Pedobacter segetis TaxID=2793069 RepID=A0ABS1BKY1_9SPHI|nr:CHC2 zinc finger domain-containing protein [Pedobacter segetis]MBK0383548.1 toprim domain-containing protein [Pedobacter segetis]